MDATTSLHPGAEQPTPAPRGPYKTPREKKNRRMEGVGFLVGFTPYRVVTTEKCHVDSNCDLRGRRPCGRHRCAFLSPRPRRASARGRHQVACCGWLQPDQQLL